MDSETNPATVLFTESERLGAFVHFWGRRLRIEKTYLDDLSGLRIPDPSGNGQLQELAHKIRELLMDELEERKRGLEKLQAACKALTNEFWAEEGTDHFSQWGGIVEMQLPRINALAAEVATAESIAERLAVEAREEDFPISSSAKKESQPLSNVLSRLLKTSDDPSSFLSADSAYRQKVQNLNDEKYMIQNEIVPQNVHYVEQDRKCVVALRHIVSTFSALQSDLAQVLNVTSSELCKVSSSVDASVESASFAERLDESFTSLIQPYRYTSYEISSSLRPMTMIFGCPLPDVLNGASIGQRAVVNAFEMILSSTTDMNPRSFWTAMFDGHKQQGDDIKLSALQLESLWDPSQRNGGPEAVNYLADTPSNCLLVYFFTRLPTPFLPLQDQEIKRLAKLPCWALGETYDPNELANIVSNAGNRMSTARRCNLARLIITLKRHEDSWSTAMLLQPDLIQILTRTPSFPTPRLVGNFNHAVRFIPIGKNVNALRLPEDFIEELRHAGLLK